MPETNYMSASEVLYRVAKPRGFESLSILMRDHDFPAPEWLHSGPHWHPAQVAQWARFFDATVQAIESAKPRQKTLQEFVSDLAEYVAKTN